MVKSKVRKSVTIRQPPLSTFDIEEDVVAMKFSPSSFLPVRLLICCLFFFPSLVLSEAIAQPITTIEAVTSIAPLSRLVEEIGGERVRVVTLIPPGQNPHTFEPSPSQIANLHRAAIYFSLDMPFERTLLAKISGQGNPPFKIIEVGEGITKLPMPDHRHDHNYRRHERHDHDHQHHKPTTAYHHHGELDPHIWLGPPQLMIISDRILVALSAADPANVAEYRRNHQQLQTEIMAMHARISKLLAPFAGQTFFVYHPAFGYFADAYGLYQRAIEISGRTPTPRQLTRLIEDARRDGVRVIFVQPQFDQRSAAAIARAINGTVVHLDPLAADVLGNLEEMAIRISAALTDNQ